MGTITNKKGNTGYYVKPWNFSFAQRWNGTEYVDAIGTYSDTEKEGAVFKFMVAEVTVHSCGKKVMRMQSMNRGTMETHQMEYKPETPIYTTREAAVEAAQAQFNANPESAGRTCIVIDDPYAAPKA